MTGEHVGDQSLELDAIDIGHRRGLEVRDGMQHLGVSGEPQLQRMGDAVAALLERALDALLLECAGAQEQRRHQRQQTEDRQGRKQLLPAR